MSNREESNSWVEESSNDPEEESDGEGGVKVSKAGRKKISDDKRDNRENSSSNDDSISQKSDRKSDTNDSESSQQKNNSNKNSSSENESSPKESKIKTSSASDTNDSESSQQNIKSNKNSSNENESSPKGSKRKTSSASESSPKQSKKRGSFNNDNEAEIQDNNTDKIQSQLSFELERLQNDTNQNFISSLRTAPILLSHHDSAKFFNDVLAQFREKKKVTVEVGAEILKTIRLLIKDQRFFAVFCENDCILKLPYKCPELIEDMLPLLYDIMNYDLNQIKDPFGDIDHFMATAIFDPLKALATIRAYAMKAIEMDNEREGPYDPWTVIDILYNGVTAFMQPEVYQRYLTVVIQILQNYRTYKKYRLRNYWELFVGLLDYADESMIPKVIIALCYLKNEFRHTPELPFDKIIQHIDNREIRSAIITLLASYVTINPEALYNEDLVRKLLYYARKNVKASLVLMKMAEIKELSELIIENDDWFTVGLPEPIDTLKLFLAVFNHKDLRNRLSKFDNFVPFLCGIVTALGSNAGTLALISMIVSKVKMTSRLYKKFEKYHFLKKFMKAAIGNDDKQRVSYHAALVMINTFLRYQIYSPFEPYIKWLDKVKDDELIIEEVSCVLSSLCNDEKCAQIIANLKIYEFYKSLLSNPKSPVIVSNGMRLIKKLKEHELISKHD